MKRRTEVPVTILIAAVTLATHGRATASAVNVRAQQDSCLVLEWMDPHDLLPRGERWMAKETLRVLAGANVDARWNWSSSGEPSPSDDEHRIRVVLVPSEPSGPGWELPVNTLGATATDGANPPPAVYIFYNTIVSAFRLDGANGFEGRAVGNDVLGLASRAFGRVVAHEIAHAIAPGEPHAGVGLMQADPEPALFLDKGDVAIDRKWKRVLNRGVSRLCSDG